MIKTLSKLFILFFSFCLFSAELPFSGEPTIILVKREFNTFAVGVKTKIFKHFQAKQPENSHWCWAASSQMVLNYYGVKIDQSDLVKKIFGNDNIKNGGTLFNIANAVSGYKVNGYVTKGSYITYNYAESKDRNYVEKNNESMMQLAQIIFDDLSLKRPIIVGMQYPGTKHAQVLTNFKFRVESEDKIIPVAMYLREPEKAYTDKYEMSFEEFKSKILGIVRVELLSNE